LVARVYDSAARRRRAKTLFLQHKNKKLKSSPTGTLKPEGKPAPLQKLYQSCKGDLKGNQTPNRLHDDGDL